MHNHRLYIKDSIKQINELQKVKFVINDKMINFINKYQFELTVNYRDFVNYRQVDKS